VPCMVSHGASNCRRFVSGYKFTLEDHYRGDLNQAYFADHSESCGDSVGFWRVERRAD